MKRYLKKGLLFLVSIMPLLVQAQAAGANGMGPNGGLNGVLDRLFEEMIPMAGRLIGVAQAIAGFAALWYIAVRVWKHIARAEPIDFFSATQAIWAGADDYVFSASG